MKSFLTPTYTFTPGTSGVGTVDLSDIANFDIKRLVAIINQTTGALIYSTANPTLKFTAQAAGVVTLFFDTTGMNGADKLQVIYEDLGVRENVTLKHARVSLPTAGTAVPATTDGAAVSATRRYFSLFIDPDDASLGTEKYYVGASTVSIAGATKGQRIFPGVPFVRENDAHEFYIVSDTATQFFNVTEEE